MVLHILHWPHRRLAPAPTELAHPHIDAVYAVRVGAALCRERAAKQPQDLSTHQNRWGCCAAQRGTSPLATKELATRRYVWREQVCTKP